MACETATKTDMVMVFGEITTKAVVDYEAIVRKTCRDIGFTSADVGLDADNCKVVPGDLCCAHDAALHLSSHASNNAAGLCGA